MNEIARSVITIDPDFAAIWGDLDNAAYEGLKAEIISDGIRDPLVIWNPDNNHILVDGHNRLRVAKELNMMAVPVSYKVFKDKADAAAWIVSHQSARRNLTDWQKYKAAEVFQKIVREQAEANHRANGGDKVSEAALENSPKPVEKINTRKETAKASGMSEFRRDSRCDTCLQGKGNRGTESRTRFREEDNEGSLQRNEKGKYSHKGRTIETGRTAG